MSTVSTVFEPCQATCNLVVGAAGNSGGIGIAVTLQLNIKGKCGELLQHWVGCQTGYYNVMYYM